MGLREAGRCPSRLQGGPDRGDTLPVDALARLLPFCDPVLSTELTEFIRHTRLRSRKLTKVHLKKALFDRFYVPALSAAGAATPAGGMLDPNHQCSLSLAVVGYLRAALLRRQVVPVAFPSGVPTHDGTPAHVAPPSPSRKFQKAKAAMVKFGLAQSYWKKLQAVVLTGAARRRRRGGVTTTTVFHWAAPFGGHPHRVHVGTDAVADVQAQGDLVVVRSRAGAVYATTCCPPPEPGGARVATAAPHTVGAFIGRSAAAGAGGVVCIGASEQVPAASCAVSRAVTVLVPKPSAPGRARSAPRAPEKAPTDHKYVYMWSNHLRGAC